MSNKHTGQIQPTLDLEEHRTVNGVAGKAVFPYGVTAGAVIPLPLKVIDNGDGTGTLEIRDDYQAAQILADQTGAGAVLTFTFTNAVDQIWVTDVGATTTNISRCDPFGGTPTASLGIPIFNATPTPINVTPASTTIQVFTPSGSTITMYGSRRT